MGNTFIGTGVYETRNAQQPKVVYRADNGDDNNSGDTQGTAVASRATSVLRASAKMPATNERVSIVSDSADLVEMAAIIPDNVEINEPNSNTRTDTIAASVDLGTDSSIDTKEISNMMSGASAIKIDSSLFSVATTQNIQATEGTCIEHTGLSGATFIKTKAFTYGDCCIDNDSTTTDVLTIEFGRSAAAKDNGCFANQDSTCLLAVSGTRLEDAGNTGVIGLKGVSGEIDSDISIIDHPDGKAIFSSGSASITHRGSQISGDIESTGSSILNIRSSSAKSNIDIGVGTTATIFIQEYDHSTYTVTENGTLNGRIGERLYGTWNEDIEALAAAVAANAANIAANSLAISNNDTDIAALTSAVAANAIAISDNENDIAANALAISNNDTDIANNAAAIAANALAIADNDTAIAANVAAIAANALAISANDTDIAANASAIAANALAISGNDADIAANAALIAANSLAIQALQDQLFVDYQSVENIPRNTTSSSNWQTRVSMTTPTLTGLYHVEWHAVVDQSSTSRSVAARLVNQSNVPFGAVQELEPKDNDMRMPVGGFADIQFTNESIQFKLQSRAVNGGTQGIQDARIRFYKVGV